MRLQKNYYAVLKVQILFVDPSFLHDCDGQHTYREWGQASLDRRGDESSR